MPKEKTTTRKTKARTTEKKKKGTRTHHAIHLPYNTSTLANCLTDPNAPKRGLSAYMFFANEQRENVREENPGITFGINESHTESSLLSTC